MVDGVLALLQISDACRVKIASDKRLTRDERVRHCTTSIVNYRDLLSSSSLFQTSDEVVAMLLSHGKCRAEPGRYRRTRQLGNRDGGGVAGHP